MFNQDIKRIGFACKYMHPNQSLKKSLLEAAQKPLNTRSTTAQWLNRQSRADAEQRLWEIMSHNIQSYYNLIKYVGQLTPELRMVRLGSDCLPMYTHADWKYFWQQPDVQTVLAREFAQVGELARSLDVRVSMHPGQFTVLASDTPQIVENSIEEFEYHADMVRWMGFGQTFQDFKINVHISGRLGPAGIRAAYARLSPEARNCITIENEENKWGLDECLELADTCPIVLDIHHHFINAGEYIQPGDSRVMRVVDSWRGVRPTMHYSYSRDEHLPSDFMHDSFPDMEALLAAGYKKAKLRAHSDWYPNAKVNEWALSFREHADIMCESKAKNLSSISLYNNAVKTGVIQGSAYTHRDPDSSTSSEYLVETLPGE